MWLIVKLQHMSRQRLCSETVRSTRSNVDLILGPYRILDKVASEIWVRGGAVVDLAYWKRKETRIWPSHGCGVCLLA
jgi:hypothetical protein